MVDAPPASLFGPSRVGPELVPGEAGAGGDPAPGTLALLRVLLLPDENASYSGSGPIWALGGRSTVELRTVPDEFPRNVELGVTLESIEGVVIEDDGALAAGSVVTVVPPMDAPPQVEQPDVGRAKIGRYDVERWCEQPASGARAIRPATARAQRRDHAPFAARSRRNRDMNSSPCQVCGPPGRFGRGSASLKRKPDARRVAARVQVHDKQTRLSTQVYTPFGRQEFDRDFFWKFLKLQASRTARSLL